MAYVTEIHCTECGETKREITLYDNLCYDCRTKLEDRKFRKHMASLKGLSVEERLENIEKQLYHLKDHTHFDRHASIE